MNCQLLRDYSENGIGVVMDVIDREAAGQVISYAHSVQTDPSMPPIHKGHQNDDGSLASNPIAQVATSNNVLQIVRQVIGPTVALLQTQFFFGRPGTKGFLGHQDNYAAGTDPTTFTSVWLALTDVSLDNGCLQANFGSHKFGLLPVVDVKTDDDPGQDVNARKFFAVPPVGCECLTDLEVKCGTAVIIHPEVIHSSRDNTSDKYRYALLTTWIAQGAKYRPGNTAKRQHIDID